MAERKSTNRGLQEDPRESFRRPSRRVTVRKQAIWRRALSAMGRAAGFALVATVLAGVGWGSFLFLRSGALFRFPGGEHLEVVNAMRVTPEAVRERFEQDVGTSALWIPLAKRKEEIEEIPWVRSAAVERLLPNRLRVHIEEREPVAYLRQGRYLYLVDLEGVLLPVPEGEQFDFPVLAGIPEGFSLEQRSVRVQFYLEFVSDLDSTGVEYSMRISEVDVSDLENLTAVMTTGGRSLRILFGRGRYREKFQALLENQQVWMTQAEPVHSVDLRYRGQIVLNPGGGGASAR